MRRLVCNSSPEVKRFVPRRERIVHTGIYSHLPATVRRTNDMSIVKRIGKLLELEVLGHTGIIGYSERLKLWNDLLEPFLHYFLRRFDIKRVILDVVFENRNTNSDL